MLLDDKALAAAVKKCKSGVRVRYDCGAIDILGTDWFAHIDIDRLEDKPRFTLAALVEMLGYIPEGECLEIVQGKGGYAAQDLIFDAVTGEAAGYLTAGDFVTVEKIQLMYGGTLLFQAEDLRVVGVKTGSLSVLAAASDARYSEDLSSFVCGDGDSAFACRAARGYSPSWKALEGVRWNEKAPESYREADGQMELEEEDDE